MHYPRVSPLALFSLLAMLFLAAIDTTVLTTAMPLIVKKLGYPELYHWVFTAFMLCSTLVLPFYGKFADDIGIKRCMIVAGGIFIAGSALCGVASNMPLLVASRALQGLGAGGIQGLTMIAFGVLFPPEERGAKQSLISIVWGFSSLAGPVSGGYIVRHLSWRWIFGITVIIGLVALTIFILRFPEAEVPQNGPLARRRKALDTPSIALLMTGLSGFILLSSVHDGRLQLLGYSGVGLLLWRFLRRQSRIETPLIPLHLFEKPLYCLSCLIAFSAFFVGFAALTYIPMYLQDVSGFGPERAGFYMTPMMLAWPVASAGAGFLLNRLGLRWPVLMGSTLCFIGMLGWGLMAAGVIPHVPQALLGWCLIFGFGMGCLTAALLVTAQTIVAPSEIGVASSTLILLRSIGTTLGISLMGNLQVLTTPTLGLSSALALVFGLLTYFSLANVIAALRMPNMSPAQLSKIAHGSVS